MLHARAPQEPGKGAANHSDAPVSQEGPNSSIQPGLNWGQLGCLSAHSPNTSQGPLAGNKSSPAVKTGQRARGIQPGPGND